MRSHRTRLISWSTGKELGLLYKVLGQPHAGYVQPPEAKPEFSSELLKKAEASADVHFESKAPSRSTPQRVTHVTVPDKKVPYVLASGKASDALDLKFVEPPSPRKWPLHQGFSSCTLPCTGRARG